MRSRPAPWRAAAGRRGRHAARGVALLSAVALATACAAGPDVAAPDESIGAGGETPGAAPSSDTATANATSDPDVVTLLDQMPRLHPSVDGYPRATVLLEDPDGGATRLQVLVAATPADRAHGLMEVTDLPDGAGMAFVFEQDSSTGFWMKNTLIPLDIAYVSADGAIVSTTTMVPCPPDESCPSYPPDGPYRITVEVPAGFWERIGLEADWRITLEQS